MKTVLERMLMDGGEYQAFLSSAADIGIAVRGVCVSRVQQYGRKTDCEKGLNHTLQCCNVQQLTTSRKLVTDSHTFGPPRLNGPSVGVPGSGAH